MIDDYYLAASLDDTWRAPIAIKRLAKMVGDSHDFAEALRRLAREGRIERRAQPIEVLRIRGSRPGSARNLELFRRRQMA